MARGKPPTIREQGLEAWLDRPDHLIAHNNLGYKEFAAMVYNEKPVAKIARDMKASYNTVLQWIDIYKEEQSK